MPKTYLKVNRRLKMIEDYRKYIIKFVKEIEDVDFLRKVYTILVRHSRRRGA